MANYKPHNKGQVHNVAYLERQLRAGKTPAELGGKEIGRGVCKAAYLFNTGLVVKLNAQDGYNGKADKTPPKWITQFGARAPRTYKAGKYIIQEFVTPVSQIKDWHNHASYKAYRELSHAAFSGKFKGANDLHAGNVGLDANGQIVVFDW